MAKLNLLPPRAAIEDPDLLIAISSGMDVEVTDFDVFGERGFQQVCLTIRIKPGGLSLLIPDGALCPSDHETAVAVMNWI